MLALIGRVVALQSTICATLRVPDLWDMARSELVLHRLFAVGIVFLLHVLVEQALLRGPLGAWCRAWFARNRPEWTASRQKVQARRVVVHVIPFVNHAVMVPVTILGALANKRAALVPPFVSGDILQCMSVWWGGHFMWESVQVLVLVSQRGGGGGGGGGR